ncbi:hypothetical protein MMPV_004191 [Pyropia vietnamensis]
MAAPSLPDHDGPTRAPGVSPLTLFARARAAVYTAALTSTTSPWYASVLSRLPRGSTLLDVGIGTASALLAHAPLLRERQLRVVGVDYDEAYVAAAAAAVAQAGMTDVIAVVHASIYDYDPSTAVVAAAPEHLAAPTVGERGRLAHGGPPPLGITVYDAAYFSGSFMILPDQGRALAKVAALLRRPPVADGDSSGGSGGGGGGRLYWTQTFEGDHRAAGGGGWVEWLKPRLASLTSVDFGQVTYADEFRAVLAAGGVEIEEEVVLSGTPGRRCAKLVVGRPGGGG